MCKVKEVGSTRPSSAQDTGNETGAPGRARVENAATDVLNHFAGSSRMTP